MYALQGGFQLYLKVVNINPPSDDRTAITLINLDPDLSESFKSGRYISITLQYKVMCNADYYGLDCATFCVDTDDDTGHFSCSSTGEKLCLPGWSEPTTNCLTRKLILIKCQPVFMD